MTATRSRAEGKTEEGSAGPSMTVLFFATVCLLLALTLPLFGLAWSWWDSDQFQDLSSDNSPSHTMIFGFLTSPDDPMSIVHRSLTPIVGALIPFLFLSRFRNLFILPVLMLSMGPLLISIILAFLVSLPEFRDRLFDADIFQIPASFPDDARRVAFDGKLAALRSFIGKTQETLALIMTMTLGVRLAETQK